jgi:hypothetical protein
MAKKLDGEPVDDPVSPAKTAEKPSGRADPAAPLRPPVVTAVDGGFDIHLDASAYISIRRLGDGSTSVNLHLAPDTEALSVELCRCEFCTRQRRALN